MRYPRSDWNTVRRVLRHVIAPHALPNWFRANKADVRHLLRTLESAQG